MQILYGFIFLISILMIIIFFPYVPSLHAVQERFSNLGIIPTSETMPLLDSFPLTGNTMVNNNTYGDIWWQYPIFSEPSYTQITNNLRYRRNPDDGVCIDANFCNVLYKDVQNISNYSVPLPPSPLITDTSVRVNYYVADQNLFLGGQAGPQLQAFAN